MAWRIDEAVIRGELDNTTRGRVCGRIWFVGLAEPVVLDLAGDCHRDLAGRRLEFTNPSPKPGDLDKFAPLQRGTTGDISASRKVRVPDIPLDQIGEYYAAKKPFPWHWGNALYLEWYSERNGRVVIESASYDLKVVGEPAWEMTPAEEEQQRAANAGAMDGFMQQLHEAAEAMAKDDAESAASPPSGDATDDESELRNSRPPTEEEAERSQARSDLLSDRIMARVAREGFGQYQQILDEELARLRRERGEPEPTPEQLIRNAEFLAELEHTANELAAEAEEDELLEDDDLLNEEGANDEVSIDDPASDDDGDATDAVDDDEPFSDRHPLAERAYELSLRLMREPEEFGWATEGMTEEHPVAELIGATMKAGVKLAGALDGEDWPPDINFAAETIVRLKRARGYLDDALRAAADCREQKLTDLAWLASVERELTEIGAATDALIAELRALLERGVE